MLQPSIRNGLPITSRLLYDKAAMDMFQSTFMGSKVENTMQCNPESVFLSLATRKPECNSISFASCFMRWYDAMVNFND